MSVVIEGREVTIPEVQGNPEVFTYHRFFFTKPKWIPDESCTECPVCYQSFTTLRRKHHCRQCGRVLCSKCCNQKVPLPQFALDEPQRVCIICRDVAELVAKARSQFISHRQEAAVGLAKMLKNVEDLRKMVGCGGMQTILSLTSQGDIIIWDAVASAAHFMSQHFPLHEPLLKAGAIKAISYLLETIKYTNEQLVMECLTTLSLFCSNKRCIHRVLDIMDLGSVEEQLFSPFENVSLLAARVLYYLVKQLDLHGLILQRSCSLLSNILRALKTGSIQMQDQCLKILTCLSAGDDNIKQRIIIEDGGGTGHFLLPFLKYKSAEVCHILEYALCLLGNLACSASTTNMAYLQPHISPVLELLKNNEALSVPALTHLARTLANLAEVPVNALPLVNSLSLIVSSLLTSNDDAIRLHACRMIISLLTSEPSVTLESLALNGADDFLDALFKLPGIQDILNSAILKSVSKLSLGHP